MQEAKEISKIAYKENFIDIMSQTDALRMNRINRMIIERSKLKMPSSFPNDAREQMKGSNYHLNSDTESKEEIVYGQGQAKPATYSPKTNKKNMTGAVESLNGAPSLTAVNKAYLDSSNTAQTNSAHNRDKELIEKKYNHISFSQKPAADKPRSLLGNIFLRGKEQPQEETANNTSWYDKTLNNIRIKTKEVARRSKQGLANVYNKTGDLAEQAYHKTGDLAEQAYNKAEGIPEEVYNTVVDLAVIAGGAAEIAYDERGEIKDIFLDTALSIHDIKREIIALPAHTTIALTAVAREFINQQLIDLKRYVSDDMSKHLGKLYTTPLRPFTMLYDKYNALKGEYLSDKPKLTQESVDLIGRNISNFEDAQKLFLANPEIMKALAIAGAEEYNRNDNVGNKLVNHVQDNYAQKFGEVLRVGGILRPDIGPFNISTKTARTALNTIKSNKDMRHILNSPEMQKILKICQTEAGLAKYILTERGSIMIGTAIMMPHVKQMESYIRENMKEVKATTNDEAGKKDKVKMEKANIAQHLANLWRQGDSRMDIIKNNKNKAESNGEKYYLNTGYEDPETDNYLLHIENYSKIDKALYGLK